MTFTEQDAENDGKIKREVGTELAKVMKTQNPEVFNHFANVCDEVGRSPADVFGEMAVRSLNSEEYAERVASSELSMKQLRADEIRLEDVKYVKQLTEELGLNEQQESRDPIDQLIDQRLQSITRSPIPRLNSGQGDGGGSNEDMTEFMKQMHEKMENLESKIDEDSDQGGGKSNTDGKTEKSIDDLFEGDGGGDSDGEREGVQTDDSVEVGDEGEPGEAESEEVEVDHGPTEEQLDEAFDGALDVTDAGEEEDSGSEGPFSSDQAEEEIEYRDNEVDEEDEEQ